MQTAGVYLGLVRERGQKGLPLERVYRQLFNRDLYLKAYGKIYRNSGAMTQGTTEETVDSMSLTKIDAIINALRQERYHWKPVRRVYIVRFVPLKRLMKPGKGVRSVTDLNNFISKEVRKHNLLPLPLR